MNSPQQPQNQPDELQRAIEEVSKWNLHHPYYATLLSAAKQLQQVEKERDDLKLQWKEYCDSYDKMMSVHKDEKRDIAARCGYPWDVNDVGLEPWIAADELRKEHDSLKAALRECLTALDDAKAFAESVYAEDFSSGSWELPSTPMSINEALSNPTVQAIRKENR